MSDKENGPLTGIRVVEFCGIGPAPFCAMLLADLGADVLLIDRAGPAPLALPPNRKQDLLHRNKRSVVLDLKSTKGRKAALKIVAKADILIEGFRPGVMERLEMGPKECFQLNPTLVFGRMTGWGQTGPLSQTAAHDLNYIGLTGALDAIGRSDSAPTPPLNLLGDNGGGALYLAIGVLAALTQARTSKKGQVVDAAIVDGVASLMTMINLFRQVGIWEERRGQNIIDSGAPFYDVFETKDGRYVAVAPLEEKFFVTFLKHLDLDASNLPDRWNKKNWKKIRSRIEPIMKLKTRDEWSKMMEESDACCTPVLCLSEIADHPHNQHRDAYQIVEGILQPSPAPRFSAAPLPIRRPPPDKGEGAESVLSDWGFDEAEVEWFLAE